ncbi:MAG: hypothetical protein KAH21_00820, partial [Spirochaetaceae bacterium]|nr:hypothetical protein [Spirochaetaceae bacterium]
EKPLTIKQLPGFQGKSRSSPGIIMISLNKKSYSYTPLFCEENIWHLCHTLLNQELTGKDYRIILLTNANKSIALFSQQRSEKNKPVIWDYHVVLEAENQGKAVVFDFDSRLDFPIDAANYWNNTLPGKTEVHPNYLPDFRVIPSADYLHYFHSDRSHMNGLINQNQYPTQPCITEKLPEGGISLAEYRNLQLPLKDNSQLFSFQEFLIAITPAIN